MRRTVLLALAVLALTSCATSGQPQADSFCLVAKPIYLSPNDVLTENTLRAVVTLNEKGADLCGWKPPHPKPAS